jgi:hypothetical protein
LTQPDSCVARGQHMAVEWLRMKASIFSQIVEPDEDF